MSDEQMEVQCQTAADHVDEKDQIIRKLQNELDHFIKSGIVEVAVRNQSVSEYMKHWEGRATKAEATLRKQQAEIERLHNVLEQIHKKRDAQANWELYARNSIGWEYCADDMANLARAALKEKAMIEKHSKMMSSPCVDSGHVWSWAPNGVYVCLRCHATSARQVQLRGCTALKGEDDD